MKKIWIIVLAVIIIGIALSAATSYNRLVSMNVKVDEQWAQVETVLQRRFDLIPNLLNTTKGYAKHEKDVFETLAKARANYSGAKDVGQKVKAANEFEGALARLMVIVENYPVLKANENFIRLTDELSGTENRIAVERHRFNESVGAYNKTIKQIPDVITAKMFGFNAREFFKAAENTKTVPEVKFE
jgi:LemA protein